jgi:hypothetical protein
MVIAPPTRQKCTPKLWMGGCDFQNHSSDMGEHWGPGSGLGPKTAGIFGGEYGFEIKIN